MDAKRFQIEWTTELGVLRAIEPALDEVGTHAATLAAGYNDPANAELMGHTEAISEAEVVDHYREQLAAGTRMFLLFAGDRLVGDADLRGLRGTSAEFAFMIAAPDLQGRGLGTRFAIMIHAFGFARLDLTRIYASVVPHNTASRRVFDKLGYVRDDGPAARAYADEPGDVTLALERGAFERTRQPVLDAIQIALR